MARTVKIRVMDGDATGCQECSIVGWTGIAFKIPRSLLPKGSTRARKKFEAACHQLKQGGIYFLFGRTNEGNEEHQKTVYVGKGDWRKDSQTGEESGVLLRVMQTHKNKKFPAAVIEKWEEVVMLVSLDDERNPLELDRLERKFHERLDSDNYRTYNTNIPHASNKGDDKDIEYFVDYAETALIAFGHNVLKPLTQGEVVENPVTPQPEPPSTPLKDGLLLSLEYQPETSEKEYKASGKYISEKEFVLLKGSEFCPTEIPSCSGYIRNIRKRYADKIDNGKLTSDIKFRKSGTAAAFVCGSDRYGKVAWHDPQSKKKKLGELLGGKD